MYNISLYLLYVVIVVISENLCMGDREGNNIQRVEIKKTKSRGAAQKQSASDPKREAGAVGARRYHPRYSSHPRSELPFVRASERANQTQIGRGKKGRLPSRFARPSRSSPSSAKSTRPNALPPRDTSHTGNCAGIFAVFSVTLKGPSASCWLILILASFGSFVYILNTLIRQTVHPRRAVIQRRLYHKTSLEDLAEILGKL